MPCRGCSALLEWIPINKKKNDGVSEGKTRIKKKIQQSLTYALKEKSKARTKKDKWLMKERIRSSETDQPQVTLTMNCKNNKILI